MNGLSCRRKEILEWVWMGKTNGEIAQILYPPISPLTVKNHIRAILSFFGVCCRVAACREAIKKGYIAPELPSPVLPPVELVVHKEPELPIAEHSGVQVFASGDVDFNGRQIHLCPTEIKLLAFLLTHAERVHTRQTILDEVWGNSRFVEERTVDVHILKLRKCLALTRWQIDTVRGYGYRLVER